MRPKILTNLRTLWVALLGIAIIGLAASVSAQSATCKATPDLGVFLDNLRQIAVDGRAYDATRAKQLAMSIQSLERQGFGQVHGGGNEFGPVGQAMNLVSLSMSGGRVVDLSELRRSLDRIDRVIDYLCSLEEVEVLTASKLDHPSLIQRSGAGGVHAGKPLQVQPSLQKLGFVLFLLAAALGLSFLAHLTYRWAFALKNCRSTCKIYGALEVGLDVVDGSIVILGRKGCRFEPVNQGAFERVMNLDGVNEGFVLIGDERLACAFHGAIGTSFMLFFHNHLSRSEVRSLLELSVIEPRFLLSGTPSPTGKLGEGPAT